MPNSEYTPFVVKSLRLAASHLDDAYTNAHRINVATANRIAKVSGGAARLRELADAIEEEATDASK